MSSTVSASSAAACFDPRTDAFTDEAIGTALLGIDLCGPKMVTGPAGSS